MALRGIFGADNCVVVVGQMKILRREETFERVKYPAENNMTWRNSRVQPCLCKEKTSLRGRQDTQQDNDACNKKMTKYKYELYKADQS